MQLPPPLLLPLLPPLEPLLLPLPLPLELLLPLLLPLPPPLELLLPFAPPDELLKQAAGNRPSALVARAMRKRFLFTMAPRVLIVTRIPTPWLTEK
jgi:hypothetical protein